MRFGARGACGGTQSAAVLLKTIQPAPPCWRCRSVALPAANAVRCLCAVPCGSRPSRELASCGFARYRRSLVSLFAPPRPRIQPRSSPPTRARPPAAMDDSLHAQFQRIEAALGTLVDSIAAYNPSPQAAADLMAADDELSRGLDQRACPSPSRRTRASS
jgi:hypothetical protein